MNRRKLVIERPTHKSVVIEDSFWNAHLHKIHTVTVWDILTKFEHDYTEGIMKNYERVISGEIGKHVGPPWYDGLICETIRGISDIIASTYDKKLDDKIEYYTSLISAAQDKDPDGYIDTYTTLMCPDQRWGENGGNLLEQHDIYNIGCLVEAGIHYFNATGKTSLLKCGVKAANCMSGVMGPAPRKNIVPAHPLAEEALVKLYRLFEDHPELIKVMKREYGVTVSARKYLDLAQFWIDYRGVHADRASFPHYMGEVAQDHCEVIRQSEAVGHAVRAALLYTGLTAVGIETGEDKYLDAAVRIWNDMELTKLHISGGIGAMHNEEKFGYQYNLPNNAYLETCAGVALAFWSGEMHRAFGDAKYINVLERALYNNVLPCLSADGKHYFYENPLISDGTIERWSWHSCPCCPPMFLKLMGCLQDYIYSIATDEIYINLHIGSSFTGEINGVKVTIRQEKCSLPWKGENHIVVHTKTPLRFTISVRVPDWAGKCTISSGDDARSIPDKTGYIRFTRTWNNNDRIDIHMELPIMKIQAHPYVDADVGRVAIQRGPLLYCWEDVEKNFENEPVLAEAEPINMLKDENFIDDATLLSAVTDDGRRIKLIPYYLWNNRGPAKMAVWLLQKGYKADKMDLDGWEGKLYRIYCPQDKNKYHIENEVRHYADS